MGKMNFFLLPTLSPLGNFRYVARYGSSSKNIRKMNLQPTLNRNSPHAHIKLEFDELGVAGKLDKYAS